jgi:hypothetical protein
MHVCPSNPATALLASRTELDTRVGPPADVCPATAKAISTHATLSATARLAPEIDHMQSSVLTSFLSTLKGTIRARREPRRPTPTVAAWPGPAQQQQRTGPPLLLLAVPPWDVQQCCAVPQP